MNDRARTEAIGLCEDRAALYRLIATLYFQPLSQEQIDALASGDLAGAAAQVGSPFAGAYAELYGGDVIILVGSPSAAEAAHRLITTKE
mgnify:CR=1 FL=1